MPPTAEPTTSADLDALAAELTGALLRPGEPDYDRHRRIALASVDPRPAAIARVADARDVATVVRWAARTGTELAIRSGGHSGAGHGSVDGGVVIDVRELKTLDVDRAARTAWADAGLTAGEVTEQLAPLGLAVGFGDTGSVGIGGITLGGGIGYLVRKHGLTIDNLRAVELVTADGEVRHVDADTDPDLFWAVRGGGGNVGVVTRFQYELHPLEQIVGGMLVLPATADTVEGFLRLADEAPDELSTIANVMTCPPMPMVPEEHHGSIVIMGMLCWSGDVAEGQRVIDRFRGLAEPLADLVSTGPMTLMYSPEEPDSDDRPTAVARTMFLDRVDRETAAHIVDRLETADAPFRAVQLRALGGAASRVPVEATAYAHRASRFMVALAAFYDGPDDRAPTQAWVDGLAAELQQEDTGAYVNFVNDEGPERVRAAYPGATWDRLVAIKRRWDPTNLFHRNHNAVELAEA